MSASFKLVSLNVERSLHLDIILPFLEETAPDVVCLQELLERDIPHFEKIIGPCRAFGIDGLMVDGIFSSPAYTVSDVEMVCGVSDHCALVATASHAG